MTADLAAPNSAGQGEVLLLLSAGRDILTAFIHTPGTTGNREFFEIMKKFAIILAGLMALTLTACNTIAGAGRDVESAGDAVEDAAEGAK